METEAFRAIVNIKEINDRGKPLMNITSRVRFNDAIFTSQIPFRQDIQFVCARTDLNQPFEFLFEKEGRKFGELAIRVGDQQISPRFETEKWFEVESSVSSARLTVKLHLLLLRVGVDSRLATPQKNTKLLPESKSEDSSPRLINKFAEKFAKQALSRDLKMKDHMTLVAKPSTQNINSSPQGHKRTSSSTTRILNKHPELKLNIGSTLQLSSDRQSGLAATHRVQRTLISEDEPPSSRTPIRLQTGTLSRKSSTFQARKIYNTGFQTQRVPSKKRHRKAKSLEKAVKAPPLSSRCDNRIPMHFLERSNSTEDNMGTILANSADLWSTQDKNTARNERNDDQRDLRWQLNEANKKLNQENRRFEELSSVFEKVKEKYEAQNKKLNSQIEQISTKNKHLEQQLVENHYESQSGHATKIKQFYEAEIKKLRDIIHGQNKRQSELEFLLEKKSRESEKIIRILEQEKQQLQRENARLGEAIKLLKDEVAISRQQNDRLKQDNGSLKKLVQNYERQSHSVKDLISQRDNLMKEAERLKTSNFNFSQQKAKHLTAQSNSDLNTLENDNIAKQSEFNLIQSHLSSVANRVFESYEQINQYLLKNEGLQSRLDQLFEDSEQYSIEDVSQDQIEQNGSVEGIDVIEEKNKQAAGLQGRKSDTYFWEANTTTHTDEYSNHEKILFGRDSMSKSKEASNDNLHPKASRSVDSMKTKAYEAVKKDNVDIKLAEFINANCNMAQLSKLFKRKGAGIYLFGNKKLFLKVENGKVCVKLGAGHQALDKFLANHASELK